MNVLPIKHRVGGRYRFTVLDEFGNVERGRGGVPVARDPSGFLRRVGAWHQNVITDIGLDHVIGNNRSLLKSGYNDVRAYLMVGDGSTAPSTSDVALANEIARTGNDGGIPNQPSWQLVTGDIDLKQIVTREWSPGLSQIVSEYGYQEDTATTEAYIRELFRDDLGNPISIAINAGKTLRVEHEATVLIPHETTGLTLSVPVYDITDSLVRTDNYNANVYAYYGANENQYWLPFSDFGAAYAGNSVILSAPAWNAAEPGIGSERVATGGAWNESYAAGTFARRMGRTWAESDANGIDVHTFRLECGYGHGFVVAVQDGPIPKDTLHTLAIGVERAYTRI